MSAETFELAGGAENELANKVAERLLNEEAALLRTASLAGSIVVAAEQTEELLFEWGRYGVKRKHTDSEQIAKKYLENRFGNSPMQRAQTRAAEGALILPHPAAILGGPREFPGMVAATTFVSDGVLSTTGFAVNRWRRAEPASDRTVITAKLSIDSVTSIGQSSKHLEKAPKPAWKLTARRLKSDESPVLRLVSGEGATADDDDGYFVLDVLIKAQEHLKSQMPKLKQRKK